MNIIDLAFITVLAISVLVGLIRGLVREILSLVGLIASIYCAISFSEKLSKQYVLDFLENERISYIFTFVAIVVGVLFITTLVNLFFSQLLKASGLSLLNRLLGAVFSVLRGAVICSIVVMVIGFAPDVKSQSWWKTSKMIPSFQKFTQLMLKHLPKKVGGYVETAKDSARRATNEIITLPSTADVQSQSTENLHQNTAKTGEQTVRPQNVQTQAEEKLVLESYQGN